MKRTKSFALGMVLLACIFMINTPSVYAGWVNGYYKSNGTYVNGYWKSNPNGLKYDNYSFDGNWADAFNNSYYSPTKNYSSNWYTPTWVTQNDYSLGKSFYDARNSYSSFNYASNNYNYSFWDDPIYKYTPTYNYGYDYSSYKNVYTSPYFDYTTPSTYYTSPTYTTPSYTTPSYNFTTPSYTTPSYNYTPPTYTAPSYTTPSYNYTTPSYTTPSYTSPSYDYSSSYPY